MLKKEERIVFDTLFEAVSEAVVVVDSFQRIKVMNSSAEKIFGYKEAFLFNKPLAILIPKRHGESQSDFFNAFLSNKEKKQIGTKGDLYANHKNGNIFPVEIGLNPFEMQEGKYIMALIVDVSVREQQKKEILELNAELENKVKERTRSLSDTVDKLEKMNQQLDEENIKRTAAESKTAIALNKERELNDLKTKFLSMVSHEFKTPLTGISISTMLLAKYGLTEHQEKRSKHLSVINSKVHYLNSILNNFLSIEKLEKNEVKYNITNFKIKNVIDGVIDGANVLFKEGQSVVCISDIDEISLNQDERIIELTISNLVSNAIKYSREHTKVFITVTQDDENTIISVEDKGFGIPSKEQKNIFKRYYRAENVLLIEGTGIGLNIIQTHLESLGGKITFKSKQNKGTTFVVTIPNKVSL